MIDFYQLYLTIKEFKNIFFALVILGLLLFLFWDKINYLWEAQQGEWKFFHEQYKK